MKKILSKYEIESNAQTELISQICKYHNWIFTEEQFNKVLKKLRIYIFFSLIYFIFKKIINNENV